MRLWCRNLVLHEFDVGNLRPGLGRNDKEEGDDKQCHHDRKMEYIGAGVSFGQLDDKIRIDSAAFQRGMVVSIAHCVGDVANKKADKDEADRTEDPGIGEHVGQGAVGLHVERHAESQHGIENRMIEDKTNEQDKVECRHAHEEHAFARFPVIHLP